jgi:hypothetical protein
MSTNEPKNSRCSLCDCTVRSVERGGNGEPFAGELVHAPCLRLWRAKIKKRLDRL